MDYETQSKLINTYRGTFPMYSDSGGLRRGACWRGKSPPAAQRSHEGLLPLRRLVALA